MTTTTTSATLKFCRVPYSGFPISGTPPAEYWIPTRMSDRPIISTINPVTRGGSAKRRRPTKLPRKKWKIPPMTTPPISAPMAATPCPATIGIITGRNAKLVP